MHSAARRGITHRLYSNTTAPSIKQFPLRLIKTQFVGCCRRYLSSRFSPFIRNHSSKQHGSCISLEKGKPVGLDHSQRSIAKKWQKSKLGQWGRLEGLKALNLFAAIFANKRNQSTPAIPLTSDPCPSKATKYGRECWNSLLQNSGDHIHTGAVIPRSKHRCNISKAFLFPPRAVVTLPRVPSDYPKMNSKSSTVLISKISKLSPFMVTGLSKFPVRTLSLSVGNHLKTSEKDRDTLSSTTKDEVNESGNDTDSSPPRVGKYNSNKIVFENSRVPPSDYLTNRLLTNNSATQSKFQENINIASSESAAKEDDVKADEISLQSNLITGSDDKKVRFPHLKGLSKSSTAERNQDSLNQLNSNTAHICDCMDTAKITSEVNDTVEKISTVSRECFESKEQMEKVSCEDLENKQMDNVSLEDLENKEQLRKVSFEGLENKEQINKISHEDLENKEQLGKISFEDLENVEQLEKISYEDFENKEQREKKVLCEDLKNQEQRETSCEGLENKEQREVSCEGVENKEQIEKALSGDLKNKEQVENCYEDLENKEQQEISYEDFENKEQINKTLCESLENKEQMDKILHEDIENNEQMEKVSYEGLEKKEQREVLSEDLENKDKQMEISHEDLENTDKQTEISHEDLEIKGQKGIISFEGLENKEQMEVSCEHLENGEKRTLKENLFFKNVFDQSIVPAVDCMIQANKNKPVDKQGLERNNILEVAENTNSKATKEETKMALLKSKEDVSENGEVRDPLKDRVMAKLSEPYQGVGSRGAADGEGWMEREDNVLKVKQSFSPFGHNDFLLFSEDLNLKLFPPKRGNSNEVNFLSRDKHKFNRVECFSTLETGSEPSPSPDGKKLLNVKADQVQSQTSSSESSHSAVPVTAVEPHQPKPVQKEFHTMKKKTITLPPTQQAERNMTSPSAADLKECNKPMQDYEAPRLKSSNPEFGKKETGSFPKTVVIKTGNNNEGVDINQSRETKKHVVKINITPEQKKLLGSLFNNISTKIKDEINSQEVKNHSVLGNEHLTAENKNILPEKKNLSSDEVSPLSNIQYNPEVKEGSEYLIESTGAYIRVDKDKADTKFSNSIGKFTKMSLPNKKGSQSCDDLNKGNLKISKSLSEEKGKTLRKDFDKLQHSEILNISNKEMGIRGKHMVPNEVCKILSEVDKQLSMKGGIEVVKLSELKRNSKPLSTFSSELKSTIQALPTKLEKSLEPKSMSEVKLRNAAKQMSTSEFDKAIGQKTQRGRAARELRNMMTTVGRKLNLQDKTEATKYANTQEELIFKNQHGNDKYWLPGDLRSTNKTEKYVDKEMKTDVGRNTKPNGKSIFFNEFERSFNRRKTETSEFGKEQKAPFVLNVFRFKEENKKKSPPNIKSRLPNITSQQERSIFALLDPKKSPEFKFCPLKQILSHYGKSTKEVNQVRKLAESGQLRALKQRKSSEVVPIQLNSQQFLTAPNQDPPSWSTIQNAQTSNKQNDLKQQVVPSLLTFQSQQRNAKQSYLKSKYYKLFINSQAGTAYSKPFTLPIKHNTPVKPTVRPDSFSRTTPNSRIKNLDLSKNNKIEKEISSIIQNKMKLKSKLENLRILNKSQFNSPRVESKTLPINLLKKIKMSAARPLKDKKIERKPKVLEVSSATAPPKKAAPKLIKSKVFKQTLPKLNILKKKNVGQQSYSMESDISSTRVLANLLNSDVPKEKLWGKGALDNILTPDEWAQVRDIRSKTIVKESKQREKEVKKNENILKMRNETLAYETPPSENEVNPLMKMYATTAPLKEKITNIVTKVTLKPYLNQLILDRSWGDIKSKLVEIVAPAERVKVKPRGGHCRCRNAHSTRRMMERKSKAASLKRGVMKGVARVAKTTRLVHPAPSLLPPSEDQPRKQQHQQVAPPPPPEPVFRHPAPSLFQAPPSKPKPTISSPVGILFGKPPGIVDDGTRTREIHANFNTKLKRFHQGPIHFRQFSDTTFHKDVLNNVSSFDCHRPP